MPDNPQTVGAEVSQGVAVRNQLEHTLGESQRVRDGVSVALRPNLCNLQLYCFQPEVGCFLLHCLKRWNYDLGDRQTKTVIPIWGLGRQIAAKKEPN